MGRYLIAGAAGYTGSRLAARLLAQGHSVRGLVRDAESDVAQRLAAQGMAVWEGDLTEPETLVGVASGIEVVYNLTSRSVLQNGSVRRLYVDGNRNLIAACSRSRSVAAYLFAGNSAPYGDRGDAWLSEDSPVAPCYPLGEVMVEAEQAIMDLVRRHRFPAILLRVGTIYGPEHNFVDAVVNGTATIIGDGRNFVSRIQIDDLLMALEHLATHGQPGAIYNIADDEPARAADLYSDVRRRLGMLPPHTFAKEAAMVAGIDPSVVGMASASVRLCNQRLRDELGLALRYPSYRTWLDEQIAEQVAEQELVLAR